MSEPRSRPKAVKFLRMSLLAAAVLALLAHLGCGSPERAGDAAASGETAAEVEPRAPGGDVVFYGGPVVTLDEAGTVAEALWIQEGVIQFVGNEADVLKQAGDDAQRIDLEGRALLPGFFDPHLHIALTTVLRSVTDLGPCLPERYRPADQVDCPLTVFEALEKLKSNPKPPASRWLSGAGFDPSRMTLDDQGASPKIFHDEPAPFIEEKVSAERPVFILDASGHLAYVNLQAFVDAGICDQVEDCGPQHANFEPEPPGRWPTTDGCTEDTPETPCLFSGLLEETPGIAPFLPKLPEDQPAGLWLEGTIGLLEAAEEVAVEWCRAGVTTMVNGGALSLDEVDLLEALSRRSQPVLRYRTLLDSELARDNPERFPAPVIWNDEDHGLYGASGIKLWADGSTQGCTAALVDPYADDALCSEAGTGAANFTEEEIVQRLRPFWQGGWYLQVHTNGDRAIGNVLGALTTLQRESAEADRPVEAPMTMIHFTVGGNPAKGTDVVETAAGLRRGVGPDGQPVAPIDLHVSHLIGHVAFWGGSFEGILDGVDDPPSPDADGRVARLDAAREALDRGLPVSLHSDSPVSPVDPLVLVEQAVTRDTWLSPKLTDADAFVLPGEQQLSIFEALQAVTLEAARQHELGDRLGSLEKGKVADLVILDQNPLEFTDRPDEIHDIQVLATYINGRPTDCTK